MLRSTFSVRRSLLLTPTSGACSASARRRSAFVVHLDKRVQPARLALSKQRAQRAIVEGGDDEQDSRRAGRCRLPDLVSIDDEVLAQHRQAAGGGHRLKVGEAASKARRLGQHRDGVGPGRLVGARLARRRRG